MVVLSQTSYAAATQQRGTACFDAAKVDIFSNMRNVFNIFMLLTAIVPLNHHADSPVGGAKMCTKMWLVVLLVQGMFCNFAGAKLLVAHSPANRPSKQE